MPNNRRSQIITQGVARSPNRSMLRAVGFKDGDFDKPIVGIANGHSTMNPCNAGLQQLCDRAEAARAQPRARMPQTFGVITVTDGISMGTEGMKYSLVSREVIADAIETATMSQSMDGVIVIGGCDKNMPGGMIGMLRMNIPGDLRLRRHDQARPLQGQGSDDRRARSRRSASSPPAGCRRRTSTASSAARCPAPAPAAACTRRTRCRRRSRRWA